QDARQHGTSNFLVGFWGSTRFLRTLHFGWGFGAVSPPQTPSIGEVRRGPGTLWVPPPHLPNCKADRCQAKPCLRPAGRTPKTDKRRRAPLRRITLGVSKYLVADGGQTIIRRTACKTQLSKTSSRSSSALWPSAM